MGENKKLPEAIDIDPELVNLWFSIPADENISVRMPRVAFDMLYDSIHKNFEIHIDILTALQNIAIGKSYDVEKFNREVAPKVVEGANSIKKFQTILMALATDAKINPSGKAIVENKGGE